MAKNESTEHSARRLGVGLMEGHMPFLNPGWHLLDDSGIRVHNFKIGLKFRPSWLAEVPARFLLHFVVMEETSAMFAFSTLGMLAQACHTLRILVQQPYLDFEPKYAQVPILAILP